MAVFIVTEIVEPLRWNLPLRHLIQFVINETLDEESARN